MARTSKLEVTNVFERVVRAVGGRHAEAWNDVGGLRLDSNPTYGGYVIEQVHNEAGGVSRPFGDLRMGASEFVSACRFASNAIEFKRKENESCEH